MHKFELFDIERHTPYDIGRSVLSVFGLSCYDFQELVFYSADLLFNTDAKVCAGFTDLLKALLISSILALSLDSVSQFGFTIESITFTRAALIMSPTVTL